MTVLSRPNLNKCNSASVEVMTPIIDDLSDIYEEGYVLFSS